MRVSRSFHLLSACFAFVAVAMPFSMGAEKSGKKGVKGAAVSELIKADDEFLRDAADGGTIKARLGETAAAKGKAHPVKDFGAQLAREHGRMNQDLRALADRNGVELSKDPDARHADTIDRVAKLSGEEFDKVFVSEMIQAHEKGITKIEKPRETLRDGDLKEHAVKMLPLLKKHLLATRGAGARWQTMIKTPTQPETRAEKPPSVLRGNCDNHA